MILCQTEYTETHFNFSIDISISNFILSFSNRLQHNEVSKLRAGPWSQLMHAFGWIFFKYWLDGFRDEPCYLQQSPVLSKNSFLGKRPPRTSRGICTGSWASWVVFSNTVSLKNLVFRTKFWFPSEKAHYSRLKLNCKAPYNQKLFRQFSLESFPIVWTWWTFEQRMVLTYILKGSSWKLLIPYFLP